MESKKNTLIQGIKGFVIIFALTFSTSMNASTALSWGSWWANFWGSWGGHTHKHFRGCGHSGFGDGSHTHFSGCDHSGSDGDSKGGGDTIPIDGGLGILLVGAAAFGIKKLRENKNEEI